MNYFLINARKREILGHLGSWDTNIIVLGLGELKQSMQPFTW